MTPKVVKYGGYSPKNVAVQGKHGDGRTKKYRDDQIRGREAREQRLELGLQAFLNRKRREWDGLLAPVHDAMAFVKDGSGRDLSVAEVDERRRDLVATRGRYKRNDGAWAALRSQRVVVGPDGKTLKRETKSKKARPVLERVSQENTRVILHEAFELDPRLSLALTHAAKASPEGGAWKEFLEATASDVADLVEKHIGARPELVPYHPKALEGHFQPEFCIVDAEGNKRPVSQRVHLGPAMVGAARWRSMGIRGADLDALTGLRDSDAGLDCVLKSRGEKACDWLVLRDLDAITSARLKEPQYSVLRPFWEQGCSEYGEYLEERRQVIGSEAAGKRLKETEAELEAARSALPELNEERKRREAAERELEAAKTKAMHAELEAAGADRRVKDLKVAKAETEANLELARKRIVEWKGVATKAEAEAKKSVAAFANARGKLTNAAAKVKALEAENAALKAAPVMVVLDGHRWPLPEVLAMAERLAAGNERGEDEFLLDEYSGVDIGVIQQLEVFSKLSDRQIASVASAALRWLNLRNERWLELGKREVREDVRKTEKPRTPEPGDEWKRGQEPGR